MNYILDKDGNPILEPDIFKWARWMEKGKRVIAQTHVGHYMVSTVFLGLDYSFSGGTPILFESMVFDERKKRGEDEQDDGMFNRYHTRQEAITGHMTIVELVKKKAGIQ